MCRWVVCGCVGVWWGIAWTTIPGMRNGSRVMIRIPFVIVIPPCAEHFLHV